MRGYLLGKSITRLAGIPRMVLLSSVGLALLALFPVKAEAGTLVLDLTVGGISVTSFNVTNIAPGDSGTFTVGLHNTGTERGIVTIWISDIVNSEGTGPEFQSGGTGDLGGAIRFTASGSEVRTNLAMPLPIGSFPLSAAGTDYLRVEGIGAGTRVTVQWQWQLPTTAGNEVQGDGLSFTINYALQEEGAVTAAGGGAPSRFIEIRTPGGTTRVSVNEDDVIYTSQTVTLMDDQLSLRFLSGTRIAADNDDTPRWLEISPVQNVPLTTTGLLFVTPVYNVRAWFPGGTRPVTFSRPAQLTLYFNPGQLPEKIAALYMAYYDDRDGWTPLPSSGSAADGQLTVSLNQLNFSRVAVLAQLSPGASVPLPPPATPLPPPPRFEISNLQIQPTEVRPGETVTIRARVTNTGGSTSRESVTLVLNGMMVNSQPLRLEPGQSQSVTFKITPRQPGDYRVSLGNIDNTFTVATPLLVPTRPAWWQGLALQALAGVILAGGAVDIILLVMYVREMVRSARRRSEKKH